MAKTFIFTYESLHYCPNSYISTKINRKIHHNVPQIKGIGIIKWNIVIFKVSLHLSITRFVGYRVSFIKSDPVENRVFYLILIVFS